MNAEAPDLRGRAPRLTAADVFQAADALLLDGHRPTIDRVRMKLGRGSPNTINEHLDTWWANLGARLKDLPGQVLPGLPETVTHSLLQLWNLAVRESHHALRASLSTREAALSSASADLEQRAAQLAHQEQASAARAATLEDSLTLARDQLIAANRRADTLEATLHERDTERLQRQQRVTAIESELTTLHDRLDRQRSAHRVERAQRDERHAAAEAHWLQELDRARQASKEREKGLKELRAQLQAASRERAQLREALAEARGDLKTAAAVREQLQARLRQAPRSLKARSAPRSPSKPRRPAARGSGAP